MLGKTVLKRKHCGLIYTCFISARAHTSEQLVHYTFGTKFSTTHNSDVLMSPTNTILPSWLEFLLQSRNSGDRKVLPSGHWYAGSNNILCCLLTPELQSYSCSTCWFVTILATCRFTFAAIFAQEPDLQLQLKILGEKKGCKKLMGLIQLAVLGFVSVKT